MTVRTERFCLDNDGLLYELSDDPGQRTDISEEHADVSRRLKGAVAAWREELLADLGEDQRSFVIGHPDYRYTQIPARDGVAHGRIKRSAGPPNCSYFMSWTSIDDTITRDAEVPADGAFDVEVYYLSRLEQPRETKTSVLLPVRQVG